MDNKEFRRGLYIYMDVHARTVRFELRRAYTWDVWDWRLMGRLDSSRLMYFALTYVFPHHVGSHWEDGTPSGAILTK